MPELLKHKNNDLNLSIFSEMFNVYEISTYECVYLLSHEYELESLKKELKKDLENKRQVTFIVADPDNYEKIDRYSPELIKYFKKIGLKEFNIVDHRTNKFAAIKQIQSADVIFLMGGDPLVQLAFIKEYEIDKLLESFKGIIIGRSAGAMNLAKNAFCSKDQTDLASWEYEGLGLIDITIDPHFDINNEIMTAEFLKTKLKVLGLPESSFIKIDKYGAQTFFGEYYIKENNRIVKIDN